MPPPVLLDLNAIDLDRVILTRDEIYQILPHRHEFMMLDGINYEDLESRIVVGYRDIRPDEWWCKAHIPGRPLFPGVLMVEAAAHLATYISYKLLGYEGFMGFGGIDKTKFRDALSPPVRLHLVCHADDVRVRRTVCSVQGFVEGRMSFETQVTGMRV